MINVSAAFRAALASGAPQRVVLVFDDLIFSNEDIDVEGGVDFREVFCSESDITIGLTPASEITFAIFNDDGFYSEFEFGKFDAYIGVMLSQETNGTAVTRRPLITVNRAQRSMTVSGNGCLETYELCPMGTFIADRPAVVRKTLIDVQAYDQMTLFDVEMPSASELGVTYPLRADTLFRALCEHVSVQAVSYTFLNGDATLSAEPSVFKDSTMREVLAYIAQAAGANARFNRMGLLEMSWLTGQNSTYDESKYTEFENYWYEVPNIDRLHIRNEDSTAESIIGTGNNTYLLQNNPFLRQEDTPQGFSAYISPTRQTVYKDTSFSFTVTVLGATNPTFLWQHSLDNVNWENMPDYTQQTLTLDATQNTTNYYYRAAVTYNGTTVYTNSVKATLKGVTT